jgi:hypothetical protein
MDDLDFLHANLPEFEGYDDEEARHHTDQRVRAWVGGSLADVQVRLDAALAARSELREQLEATILRCQFPDQKFVLRLDATHGIEPALKASLAACDRKLVELAQESCHVDEAGLGQILAEINQTFDRRSQQVPAPSA